MKSTAANIFEAFWPLYRALRFFGIYSFSIQQTNNCNKYEVSVLLADIVSAVFWVCCYVFMFSKVLYWGEQEPDVETSLILKHGWHILNLSEMFFAAITVILNHRNRYWIFKSLKLMYQFDLVKVGCVRPFNLKLSIFS